MTTFRVAAALLALAIVLSLPAFSGSGGAELDVWQQAFLVAGVPRRVLLEYHQFPFWNPWASGGVPCLGHPYSSFLSPGFLFPLILGTVQGLKLRVLAGLWAGLMGGYLLGRRLSPGRFAPFLCAAVYILSSWYPLYMSVWHVEFIPFAYFPWLMLFHLKGRENLRWCAPGGAVLALMILEGGTYPVPLALLFITVCALLQAGIEKNGRPLLSWALIALLGFSLSGVKLLPAADFMLRNPRLAYWKEPVLPLRALPRMFFGRDQLSPTDFSGAWLGWWEYGAYVGVVPCALAAMAVFVSRKKALPFAISGILFFAVMFGDFGALSPWHWLHMAPLYSSLHDTVRFRVVTVFCLALMSALAAFRLEELSRSRGRPGRAFLSAALGAASAAVAADLVLVSAPLYGRLAIPPFPAARPASAFRQVFLPEKEREGACAYRCFLSNEGLINNWDGLELAPAALRTHGSDGYRGEVWLAEGRGSVRTLEWSPNALRYALRVDAPDTLIVNQRYDPGWRAVGGEAVCSRGGLIALSVAPGEKELRLSYVPALWYPGCALSLLGAALSAALWRKGKGVNA